MESKGSAGWRKTIKWREINERVQRGERLSSVLMIGDENKISGPVCERESEYVGEIEQVRSRLKRAKTVRVWKGDCVIATTHDTQIG